MRSVISVPDKMIAFSIVYHLPVTGEASPPIHAFGALKVTRIGKKEAQFELFNHAFRSRYEDVDAIAAMQSLIDPSAVVIGFGGPLGPHHVRHMLAGSSTGINPALPMLAGKEHAAAWLLHCRRSALAEVADAYGIPLADQHASLTQQARRSIDQAQVIWLSWLYSTASANERRYLSASFQAWLTLERVRPVPF